MSGQMSVCLLALCTSLLQCSALNMHHSSRGADVVNATSEAQGTGHLRANGGTAPRDKSNVSGVDTSEPVLPLWPMKAHSLQEAAVNAFTFNGVTDTLLVITFFVVLGACFLLDFTMLPSLNLLNKRHEAADGKQEQDIDVKSLVRRFESSKTGSGVPRALAWSLPSRKAKAAKGDTTETTSENQAVASENSNQDQEADLLQPEQEAPVARLAHAGRSAEAYRELLRLEKTSSNDVEQLSGLNREQLDAVRRIGRVYEASLPQLAQKVSTYSVYEMNENLKLEWGLKLEDGSMKVMCIQDMPDVDVMNCVVAHAEKNLATHYDKDTIKADALARTSNDGLWRTIIHTQSTGSKSDVISFTSACDALDEALGSVWVAYYTSPAHVAQLKKVAIPPTLDGHFRTDKSLYVVKLKPLRTDGHTLGVQMTSILEVGVSPATYVFLSMMPGWALKRLVRGMVETAATSLVDFCRSSRVIKETRDSSSSAGFYEQLERHLEGPGI